VWLPIENISQLFSVVDPPIILTIFHCSQFVVHDFRFLEVNCAFLTPMWSLVKMNLRVFGVVVYVCSCLCLGIDTGEITTGPVSTAVCRL